MIRTPCLPPFFTSRLCSPIHRLTSLLTCQLALSHTNTRTFLPAATSFSDNHERKRVVTPLTGRPSTIYKPKPRLLELRHEESVAGDGLRVRVVFGDRLLHEARGLAILAPGVHRWQGKAAPPRLVLEAHRPIRVALPALGAQPTHPHPLQARPHSLSTHPLLGDPFLETHLRS